MHVAKIPESHPYSGNGLASQLTIDLRTTLKGLVGVFLALMVNYVHT